MPYLHAIFIICAIATVVFSPLIALASEPEIIDVDHKTAVIFLLADACKMNLYNDYLERFTNAWIVCREETSWTEARENLYGFEKYYTVVYVTQDNQHPEAPRVQGEAFYRDGSDYAYSINNPTVIAHELLHLVEKKLFTSDGRHDYQCDDGRIEKALWEQERGAERCIGF